MNEENTSSKSINPILSRAPGSPPRTPRYAAARVPRQLQFDKNKPFGASDGPLSAPLPFLHQQNQSLDPDTIALATAAATAAYNEAIASITGGSGNNFTEQSTVNRKNPDNSPPRLRPMNFFGSTAPPTPTSPTRSGSLMSPYIDPPSSPFFDNTPRRSNTLPCTPKKSSEQSMRNRANSNEPQWQADEDNSLSVSPNGGSSSNSIISDGSGENLAKDGAAKPERDQKKMNLYKTELCRSWEETGTCRYGTKCQFAHSVEEVRNIDRHPKYKTEMCKTFWERGTCPYGKRCCFIHTENKGNDKLARLGSGDSATPPRPRVNSGNNNRRSTPEDFSDASRRSKPVAIYNESGKGETSKVLFESVNENYWSPSIASPDYPGGAFSFSERSVGQQQMQHYGDNYSSQANYNEMMNQVDNGLGSFHLDNTAPASASAGGGLSLLTPITTRLNSKFSRSTLSAGIPPPAPFFSDPYDEIPMSANAFRRPGSRPGQAPASAHPSSTSGTNSNHHAGVPKAPVASVPILATPPRKSPWSQDDSQQTFAQKVAHNNNSGNTSAKPISRPNGTLRKLDSGIHFESGGGN